MLSAGGGVSPWRSAASWAWRSIHSKRDLSTLLRRLMDAQLSSTLSPDSRNWVWWRSAITHVFSNFLNFLVAFGTSKILSSLHTMPVSVSMKSSRTLACNPPFFHEKKQLSPFTSTIFFAVHSPHVHECLYTDGTRQYVCFKWVVALVFTKIDFHFRLKHHERKNTENNQCKRLPSTKMQWLDQ